jgi:hypothetical protein
LLIIREKVNRPTLAAKQLAATNKILNWHQQKKHSSG